MISEKVTRFARVTPPRDRRRTVLRISGLPRTCGWSINCSSPPDAGIAGAPAISRSESAGT
eukprot:6436955-Pyramimonas_sp.AAC.1